MNAAWADESLFQKGILVTFIDFWKVYDRVDRNKLLQCLQGSGFGG